MDGKINIKVKLTMELITVVYFLLAVLLSRDHIISKNFFNALSIVWIIIWAIIGVYHKKLTEITDELVINILSKVNKIGVYFLMFSIGLFSLFLITPYNENFIISKVNIGIYLLLILLMFTMIRLVLFIYYDRKGIYK